MGAIYFKRRRNKSIDMIVDQAGKLFMCDETVRWQKTAPKGTERAREAKHKDLFK